MTERMAIDPGHGGRNRGCDVGAMCEADYVLALGHHFAARIRHSGEPITACMLRTRHDADVQLSVRGHLADEFGAGLRIVLHVNASVKTHLRGGIMFHLPGDEIGREVAYRIARAWPDPMHRTTNDVFAATDLPTTDDDWLRRARNVMFPHEGHPTVLVECGFASNALDRAALNDPATQSAMIAALMVGAAKYRQLQEPMS